MVIKSYREVRDSISLSTYKQGVRFNNQTTYIFNFIHHFAGVIHVFEQSLDCLLTSGHVVEVFLGCLLPLLKALDLCLDAVLLLDGFVYSLDVKDLSFDPMVDVEVGVLHALDESSDLFLHCFRAGLCVFGVAEHHLFFSSVNVDGQVELFVLVQHLQKDLVVLDASTLGVHVGSYILLHGLEQWQNLSRKMRELLALLVKLVFLNWVVEVIFNVKALSKFFYDFVTGNFRDLS